MRMRQLSIRNCFWFLLPILLWNLILSPFLAIGEHFPGEAPNWILIQENLLRILVFGFPLFMIIRERGFFLRLGISLYLFGLLLYFGSWLVIMNLPDAPSASLFGLLAPAYTPIIWLVGIALIGRSWFYGIISSVFVLFHLGEYILRFP